MAGRRARGLFGFFRQKLLLPVEYFRKFTDGELELLLTHEYVHYSSGDGIINILHIVFEVLDVAIALEEPKQFMDDRAQVKLLRRYERETFLKVKAHLITENRTRARAGTVGLLHTVFVHMAHEFFILIGDHGHTSKLNT